MDKLGGEKIWLIQIILIYLNVNQSIPYIVEVIIGLIAGYDAYRLY